jgi:hypothetical protein
LIRLIKTVIKLVLLALVANATWHLYLAYAAHYKFRDAVEYAARNRGDRTDEQLHDYFMDVAADADVPIPAEAVVVTHIGMSTAVDVSYRRPVELLPSRTYPWSFSFRIDTYTLQAPNTVASPK